MKIASQSSIANIHMRATILASLLTIFIIAPKQGQSQLLLEPFAAGLSRPVDIANAGDGSNRIFVVEQAGRIMILDGNGVLSEEPFLDIRALVDDEEGEEGLLGLVFHPDFSNNGHFFVYYTRTIDNRESVLARYTVDPLNANQVDTSSEEILLTFQQPQGNHNGGDLNFGPEGNLYIATGDGGSGNDPGERSQDLSLPLGKLLRITVDELPYSIPSDNPFASSSGDTVRSIWAYGLRNPWRFSFDNTGGLWIGDVGQVDREEINYVSASDNVPGINYGWDCREGDIACPGCRNDDCEGKDFTEPVYAYGPGPGLSVTGGYLMEGDRYPSYEGLYIFAEYVRNEIYVLDVDGTANGGITETLGARNISTFGKDESGNLYAASLSGPIFKIIDQSAIVTNTEHSLSEELLFRLHPNPATHQVQIDIPSGMAERMEIIDVDGSVLESRKIKQQKSILIDTEGFTRGLIMIRLYNGPIHHTKKLLLH
ncbi:MAG: hypothetical protein HKN87_06320 [Saprospiraceae bacterium]|nr:hypothetical protein [Saprospiraceae bacterium]